MTESNDPKQYIQRLKSRDEPLKEGRVQFVHTLEIETKGGKQCMNCAGKKQMAKEVRTLN